jgi:GT-D fold-like domain
MEKVTGSIARLSKELRNRWRGSLAAGRKSTGKLLAKVDARRAMRRQGDLLGQLHPNDDHTDFWQDAVARYPADREMVRKMVHAALKAGRISVAESGVWNLIESRRTRSPDGNFVVGLANIYQQRREPEKIVALVRQFLKSLRGTPDYRIAAVRLSRFIFSHFPRRRFSGYSGAGAAVDRNFLRMLARSAVGDGPRTLLCRTVALQEKLGALSPPGLFDTDISPAQCEQLIGTIHAHLARDMPFSLVRVGDGESNCFSYEPHLSGFAEADAADRERMWWGLTLQAGDRTRLSRHVCEAIWNADCVGIPNLARILRDVKLAGDDALEDGRTGRGLRAVLHTFEHIERFKPPQARLPHFSSCHIHQDIARWDLYPRLFDCGREVVLISCHAGLADVLQQKFAVRVAGHVVVPPRYASLAKFGRKAAQSLPETIEDAIGRLGDLPRHRLVIVGAGYLGKWLVDVAKARGGVALDLGSIVDYWLGINTRSYMDLAALPNAGDPGDWSAPS